MVNLQNQPLELFVHTKKPVYAYVGKGGTVILTDNVNDLPQHNAAAGPNWINVCLSNAPEIDRLSGFHSLNSVLAPTGTNTKIDPESGFEVAGENELAAYKTILVIALEIAENMIAGGHLCKTRFFRYSADFDESNSVCYGNVHQVAHWGADGFEKLPDSEKVAL